MNVESCEHCDIQWKLKVIVIQEVQVQWMLDDFVVKNWTSPEVECFLMRFIDLNF